MLVVAEHTHQTAPILPWTIGPSRYTFVTYVTGLDTVLSAFRENGTMSPKTPTANPSLRHASLAHVVSCHATIRVQYLRQKNN